MLRLLAATGRRTFSRTSTRTSLSSPHGLGYRSGFAMGAAANSSDATGTWHRVSKGPTPYQVYGKPIEKSPQDDREYRVIKLDNGLEAMLVHDVKADKAAASLDVAVGHLYDPVRASPQVIESPHVLCAYTWFKRVYQPERGIS